MTAMELTIVIQSDYRVILTPQLKCIKVETVKEETEGVEVERKRDRKALRERKRGK